ncbi:hypothetical protein ACET3Z_010527 [Daucus carota]
MTSSSANPESTFTALHSDIIETHLLTRFDGASLASVASTSNLLHALCDKQSLWKDICDSTWKSVQHPLVQEAISSFPGGYRSFYADSFPVLGANSRQGKNRGLVENQTAEIISAVDIHYGNNPVFSRVAVTNTDASSFPGSLFSVDLIDRKETVEIPLKCEGFEKMSELEDKLRLSWIVIDPTLKRAANVSSLRPVSVRPHGDKRAVEVTYAAILSGKCCDIDTTEFVECRIVAVFGCEEGNNMEVRELSLCLVDMVRSRLNGELSLRILQEAMENGERRKESGQGKEMYAKSLDFKRQRFVFWVFFASFLISLFWLA